MVFYNMGEAMMNVGREGIIQFFNFGVGVSADGAMRVIVLLFSLGIGALWTLLSEKEENEISLS